MIADDVVRIMGDCLLTCEELLATGRASSLSPLDLKTRVLCKGKVKLSQTNSKDTIDSSLAGKCKCTRKSVLGRRSGSFRRSLVDSLRSKDGLSTGCLSSPASSVTLAELRALRKEETAPGAVYERSVHKSKHKLSDPTYASILTLRSRPLEHFLAGAPATWPLPITSVPEHRLHRAMGLDKWEMKELQGIRSQGGLRLSEVDDVPAAAATRLARDMPDEVAKLQRLTSAHLLRP